jgi:hypothetical protein
MAGIPAQELQPLARLVVALAIVLVVAGIVWHGVSIGTFQRIWYNVIERPKGPISFRFILQPSMAAIAAFHDGLKDARAARSPFVRAMVWEPEHRIGRLIEALNAIHRIILFGLLMDIIYQVIELDSFFPTEAVIIVLLLAVVPYVVLRGLITRAAHMWRHGTPAPRI